MVVTFHSRMSFFFDEEKIQQSYLRRTSDPVTYQSSTFSINFHYFLHFLVFVKCWIFIFNFTQELFCSWHKGSLRNKSKNMVFVKPKTLWLFSSSSLVRSFSALQRHEWISWCVVVGHHLEKLFQSAKKSGDAANKEVSHVNKS